MHTALPHGPRLDEIPLPGGPLKLWRPVGADALLDALLDAPPDPDDKMPYWADLWPSALGLAEALSASEVPVAGQRALELGCGLGLVGLAAARAGAQVTASDWIEDALQYVEASAEANGLTVETLLVDWRRPPEQRWPVLLAADVLYEARNGPLVASVIDALLAPGGVAWLADPGRRYTPDFFQAMTGWQVERTERLVQGPFAPGAGGNRIQIYRLARLSR